MRILTGRSTTGAILSAVNAANDWHCNLDRGAEVQVAFFEFHAVPHAKLFSQLTTLNIE